MFQFEIDVRTGHEAERFNTAVYRFIELRAGGVTELDLVKIETRPEGPVERKTLTLATPEALADFQRYWAQARVLP